MLRDVFYYGKKPNVHPREKFAKDLNDARIQCTTEHFWIINEYCDYKGFDWDFDFEFLPDEDVWTEEHINVWPSVYQKDSGTWLCANNGSEVIIYRADVDPIKRKELISEHWYVPKDIDQSKFDFKWHPDPTDPPFIYQYGTQWQKTGGPRYIVPGATQTKYIDAQLAVRTSSLENWDIPDNIDIESFDFSWHPDDTSQPYIYEFGTVWNDRGGPKYVVPGATEYKYQFELRAKTKPDKTNWIIPDDIDEASFDWSWVPHPNDPPYIYQFATQWQKTGGPKYVTPNASEIKYVDDVKAKRLAIKDSAWKNLIDNIEFDYSWHPDMTEEPFIYVFGNQWFDATVEPTVEYHMPGATQRKYITDVIATVLPTTENWQTLLPVTGFDYSWRPEPGAPAYIYVWGNQWNNCFVEPTVVYTVPGATETKYMENEVAMASSTHEEVHWEIIIPVAKFDFSWRPDPTEPPFIYIFGNKWNDAESEPTIMYRVEGATEYKFMDNIVATPIANFTNWGLRNERDRNIFDFSWRPNPANKPAVYVWGEDGPVYTVPDATDTVLFEYERPEEVVVEEQVEVIEKVITRSMFYVDRGNSQSQERFNILKERFPQLVKTRYLNSWVDTITRCTTKSETELFWVLNSELDYTEFKFDYNPNPWQKKMIHVFGTQWTHWGNTYLVNKNSFNEDTKYVKVIEHLSMLNFVKDKRATASNCLYDVILVNHGNESNTRDVIQSKIVDKSITDVTYKHSYLRTFKDALAKLETKKEHYVWICSSICDYTDFDFSYVCDPFAKDQLHVFPSDKQKFGDTFLVDVNKFRTLVDDMLMLEDYEKVNYNQHQRVKRLPAPTYINEKDTNVSITDFTFNWPYITIQASDNQEIKIEDNEPMSLWTPDSKNIIIHSTGGTCITVPREATDYVERELYDYPYISRSSKLVKSKPLDIVFLSNGEKGADENYEHLLSVTRGLPNRVVRIDGVNGRVQAYHAAAEASNTPWMFTVFAKLRVDKDFDWSWQPDRLQVPKHYIFNASNPVNNLVYGHQAMIAYNKRITLANSGRGLDFTLDDEHEVVDMNSGVAMYNTDEWSTWRTAFREALKLKDSVVKNPNDTDSVGRLLAWSTIGNNEYGQYSIDGALDAIEYYDSVDGDMDKLRLSYDWPWLRSYFDSKYK